MKSSAAGRKRRSAISTMAACSTRSTCRGDKLGAVGHRPANALAGAIESVVAKRVLTASPRGARSVDIVQETEHSAGLLAGVQLHHSVPEPDRADSAERGVSQVGHLELGASLAGGHVARSGGLLPSELRRVAGGRHDQRGGRVPGGVGAGALSVSRQGAGGRPGGPSLRAAHGGGRHRADQPLYRKRLAGALPGAAGHQGGVYSAGRGGGADVHRPAVRGAQRAAGAGGRGRGTRRGRCQPGRQPLAGVPAGDLPVVRPALLTGFALAFARAEAIRLF